MFLIFGDKNRSVIQTTDTNQEFIFTIEEKEKNIEN